MRTLVVLLMVTSEWCRGSELLEVNDITRSNVDKLLKADTKPSVYFAVEIHGFNSSRLQSGPIVLQDKKTIFISDLQYKGTEKNLSYWTGASNPDAEKKLISQEPFLGNHTNIYLSLSSAFTLDNATFLGVGEADELLAYVTLTSVNKSLIREDRKLVTDKALYTIPKCCPQQELIYVDGGCHEAPQQLEWNFTIFESNVTGLDPDIILDGAQYELNPYHYRPKCDDGTLIAISQSEIYGLIYNSSLIIKGDGIKAHHEFCVDKSFDSNKNVYQTATIVCYSYNGMEQVSNLYLYLPDVILSTICFAITAVIYWLILNENIILKKCIILFSSSMCVVFISLIVINVQANVSACRIFGFSFLTMTVFSFLWLPISCIELFYLVFIVPEHKQKKCRWYYYVGVSSAISILILTVSLFSGDTWVPDIPNTFIRHPSSCTYNVEYKRTFILFVPMILSFALSVIFIIMTTKWIRKRDNQEEIRNTYYWIQNRNNYKFMCRTYMVIVFASLLWCAHLFYYHDGTQLTLDVLEAALGIVTLAALVLNKYTRKEISSLYRKKPTVTAESLNMGAMGSPTTPDYESNPFFSNNHSNGSDQPNNR